MKNILPLSADDFRLFRELLIETSGLLFEETRTHSLHLALWQRVQHRGYDSYREYYNLLKFHPQGRLEIRELLDLVTIGETYFFRNKAQFDVLMKFVLPEIMEKKINSGAKRLRVWSAGCSGGDEPYSIAIAMTEVVPSYKDWHISILGTDINRNALAYAKEAIYSEKHIGHLPKEYVVKYFNARDTTYTLDTNVVELARFEYHNLAKDSFLHEEMQGADLIFCRNVIIYFDSQTTQRVIENFYNCLAQDGYLFLGHAETLWQITDKFERIEFPQTFIYKKRLSPFQESGRRPFIAVPDVAIDGMTLSAPPIPASETKRKNGLLGSILNDSPPSGSGVDGRTFSKETDVKSPSKKEIRAGLEEMATPLDAFAKPSDAKENVDSPYRGVTLGMRERKAQTAPSWPNTVIAHGKDHIHSILTKATLLANEAKYKEAADILGRIVEADNLTVGAYYLLGVLSYKSGDLKEAETQFRKVIYVDPHSVIAYFNLGNMYLYQRKFSEAAREFRNAIRLLEKRPKNEQVRFCEDFTVEFLLRACKNALVQISQRGERYE